MMFSATVNYATTSGRKVISWIKSKLAILIISPITPAAKIGNSIAKRGRCENICIPFTMPQIYAIAPPESRFKIMTPTAAYLADDANDTVLSTDAI